MADRALESSSEIRFSDGVVTIRPFTEKDAEDHLTGEDEEQVKWLSGGKSTLGSVKKWIAKNQEYWSHGNGPVYNFAIEDNESGKLLGMVEADASPAIAGIQEGDANISYGLYPHARGKGYATRALNLLLEFLKSMNVKRAVIRVRPENSDSAKVPPRLNFQQIDSMTTKDGEVFDMFVKNLDTEI